ncbi:MAG: hypothetical protein U5K51_00930 [Flavobacteriaceae bacterium]|nr:hypothetical protein [Flavobacteriaceae bacterium]
MTNHLDYFKMELKSAISNGKKLGFISQEIRQGNQYDRFKSQLCTYAKSGSANEG